jgi:hypothetical protein
MNTSFLFIKKITGKSVQIDTRHMPMPVDKRLQMFIWKKYENDLLASCKDAHIRKPYTITNQIYYALNEIFSHCEFKPIYNDIKTAAMWLNDNTTEAEIEKNLNTCHIVCLNDSEMLHDENNMRNIITRKCECILPEKSSFEV